MRKVATVVVACPPCECGADMTLQEHENEGSEVVLYFECEDCRHRAA